MLKIRQLPQDLRTARALPLIIFILTFTVSETRSDTAPVAKPQISVSPTNSPEVGENVALKCEGPLIGGGILFFSDGESKEPVNILQFDVDKVISKKKVDKKTLKALKTPLKGKEGYADRFTASLNSNRSAIFFNFRIKYSDNGFYGCKFLSEDKKEVVATTSRIGVFSFYPARVDSIRCLQERNKEKEYYLKCTCKAFTGVPQGDVRMIIERRPNPKRITTTRPFKEDGAEGILMTLSATTDIKMDLLNRSVLCFAGLKTDDEVAPGNPVVANKTTVLNLKVPVDKATILEKGRVFRHPGGYLNCSADGYPKPEITWTLNGNDKRIVEGPIFKVPRKLGIYEAKCVATHQIFGEKFEKSNKFRFAVVQEGCAGQHGIKDNTSLIVAAVLAAIFGVLALISTVGWCLARKRRDYSQMQ